MPQRSAPFAIRREAVGKGSRSDIGCAFIKVGVCAPVIFAGVQFVWLACIGIETDTIVRLVIGGGANVAYNEFIGGIQPKTGADSKPSRSFSG